MVDTDIVRLDERHCTVQLIAKDGNCMFGSIAHQIFRYDARTVMHRALTRTIREMIVEHITLNLHNDEYVLMIKSRVQEEFPHMLDDDDMLTCMTYLRALNQDGFWGASESLLAAATLFDCDIEIYRECGYRTLVTCEGNNATNLIRLVYRGPINAWNHYDSFLDFVPLIALTSTVDLNAIQHVSLSTWWSRVRHDGGFCIVLNTLPDGNCMFSAIAHQMFGSDIGSRSHIENTTMLRRQAVDYLRSHLDVYRIGSVINERLTD